MYESYYHFQQRPFSATPNPNCFFITESIREIVAEFIVCTERGQGIGVLTGAAGMGKTLFCEALADELSEKFTVALLKNANFVTRRSFLQGLQFALRQPYSRMSEQELRLEFVKYCESVQSSSDGVVLILDEAHLLSPRLLEEVRTVTNLTCQGIPLVRVVLVGQPDLEETLAQPAMTGLNGRIACQQHLEPLTRVESRQYVEYRVNWAGANPQQIFSDEALDAIVHAADGVPRCLNQLCDHTLLLAYVADAEQIGSELVDQALQDLKQLPQHWNEKSRPAGPLDALSAKQTAEKEPAEDQHVATHAEYEFDMFGDEGVESIEIGGQQSAGMPEIEQSEEESNEYRLALPGGPDVDDVEIEVEETDFGDEMSSDVRPVDEGVLTADKMESAQQVESGSAADDKAIAGVVPLASDRQPGPIMFEEEVVVDRYAALEAGRREVPALASSQDDSAAPVLDEPTDVIEFEPTDVAQPAEANTASAGVIHEDSQIVAAGADASGSDEEICSEILDLCKDARQTIVGQINELDFGTEFPAEDPAAGSFDVVELEPAGSSDIIRHDVQANADSGAGEEDENRVVPQPNLRRLFSKLRRVHHERTEGRQ